MEKNINSLSVSNSSLNDMKAIVDWFLPQGNILITGVIGSGKTYFGSKLNAIPLDQFGRWVNGVWSFVSGFREFDSSGTPSLSEKSRAYVLEGTSSDATELLPYLSAVIFVYPDLSDHRLMLRAKALDPECPSFLRDIIMSRGEASDNDLKKFIEDDLSRWISARNLFICHTSRQLVDVPNHGWHK